MRFFSSPHPQLSIIPRPAPAVLLAPAQDPGGTPQLAQGFIQGFKGLNLFACVQGGQRF
jgi:hypothetical protein